MDFRVDLDSYRGPLDLLLYLVRRHEVEVMEIPIAAIAQQYMAHLEALDVLDANTVGEFLDIVSTLVEIKSRLVLPRVDEEEEPIEDPHNQLVEQLLEYKKYKDVASMLEERGRQWQMRYARVADDLPPRRVDPGDQPIHQVELWDLVSAFGRIMRESQATQPSNFVYDETPIQAYMQQIHERLQERERVSFSELFGLGTHKSALIGIFLAVLELVRHHSIRTEQGDGHGEIWILPDDQFNAGLDWSKVDDYSVQHGS